MRDPPEAVAAAHFRSGNPPALTLYTNVRIATGKGAHTALVIDGPERVVFNPAGTWHHPKAPRIDDVHYGFTEPMEAWFVDYHARETYYVRQQKLQVPMATAARALQLAEETGPVMATFCTLRTSQIIAALPGFEDFPRTLFPDVASEAFAQYPGVETRTFHDDSPDDRSDIGGIGGYGYIGQGVRVEG
ncbi:hypothetical protein [Mangrovicoccus algicola]|uniref:Uncharacterized protein n=1 Tax=Mangrovicoccus algicola TaxID=2771008 RepID=A0A8J6YUD5_9RHOB|nr:hypothetical protein [Mangrovicoccus algicola]MBE3639438.1 hypothetical protein [Mangrovicoccus algicola]